MASRSSTNDDFLTFPGENGGTLYCHKPTGHFHYLKDSKSGSAYLRCADKQFFDVFHLPVCQYSDETEIFPATCLGRIASSSHPHSHLPAPRENVELMAFRWQARLYILQNSRGKSTMDAIKAVYADWPFKLKFSPPRLSKLMGSTLKTYRIYGNAMPKTADHKLGRSFLEKFPQKVLDEFMDHLRTTPSYWTPPQPRGSLILEKFWPVAQFCCGQRMQQMKRKRPDSTDQDANSSNETDQLAHKRRRLVETPRLNQVLTGNLTDEESAEQNNSNGDPNHSNQGETSNGRQTKESPRKSTANESEHITKARRVLELIEEANVDKQTDPGLVQHKLVWALLFPDQSPTQVIEEAKLSANRMLFKHSQSETNNEANLLVRQQQSSSRMTPPGTPLHSEDEAPCKVGSTTSGGTGRLAILIRQFNVNQDLASRCNRVWSVSRRVCAEVEEAVRNAKTKNVKPMRQLGDIVFGDRKLFYEHLENALKTQASSSQIERIVEIAENTLLFKSNQLKQWLKYKQSESEMMDTIDQYKGDVTILSKRQLAKSFGEVYTLVLNIPPLDSETNKIFGTITNPDPFAQSSMQNTVNSDPWHLVQQNYKPVLDKIRELSEHVENNKNLAHRVKFFITFSNAAEDFTGHYYIYKAGQLTKDHFDQLPRSPTGLKIQNLETSPCVMWEHENLTCNYNFIVDYRSKDGTEKSWKRSTVPKPEFKFESGSALEIRVAINTYCIGRSKFSKVIVVPTVIKQIQPNVKSVTESTAQLEWASSVSGNRKFSYRVLYWRDELAFDIQKLDIIGGKTDCLLKRLSPETKYHVNVMTFSEDRRDETLPSKTAQFTTSPASKATHLAENIVKNRQKIGNWNDLDIYTIPITETTTSNKIKSVRRFAFGEPNPSGRKDHKTILLMGAKGSGKTTLINSMINYIFKVQWEDPFRFQLIEDQIPVESQQMHRKTECINIYDIYHVEGFKIPFSLTVVDTPGYDEIRQNKDVSITKMIRQLIEDRNGIKELDMICYVLKKSSAIAKQKPYFESILSMFGNDFKRNVNLLLTFTDGQVSTAAIPFQSCLSTKNSHYKPLPLHSFNNFDFFCSNKQASRAASFWNMAVQNFQRFISELSSSKTRSLTMTKLVLEEKKRLEETGNSMATFIKLVLDKKNQIKEDSDIISGFKSQIESSKKCAAATKFKKVELPLGQLATNCNICSVTCRNLFNFDIETNCWIVDRSTWVTSPFCSFCPGKCGWNAHSDVPYRMETINQASDILEITRLQYEADLSTKMLAAQHRVTESLKEVDANEKSIQERVDTIRKGIERLQDIVLYQKPFLSVVCIDLIIQAEQKEKRTGFQERLEILQKLRLNHFFGLRKRNSN